MSKFISVLPPHSTNFERALGSTKIPRQFCLSVPVLNLGVPRFNVSIPSPKSINISRSLPSLNRAGAGPKQLSQSVRSRTIFFHGVPPNTTSMRSKRILKKETHPHRKLSHPQRRILRYCRPCWRCGVLLFVRLCSTACVGRFDRLHRCSLNNQAYQS